MMDGSDIGNWQNGDGGTETWEDLTDKIIFLFLSKYIYCHHVLFDTYI